ADGGLPAAPSGLFFALPGLIAGCGGSIQFVRLQALRQSITPERLLGRVYASTGVLGRILSVAGALLGGLLGETLGLRPAVAVAAVGYGIPFLYALTSPLRTASTRAETEDPAAADETEAVAEPA